MAGASDSRRLSPPLSHVFRAAHAARDARKKVDLRDEGGERIIAGRLARTAITEPVLRREVAADLEKLMNTVNLASVVDLGAFGHVARSVLNFGIPDVVHRTIDEGGTDEIVDELVVALKIFEPRLLPNSLRVKRDTNIDIAALKVRFLIQADLVCDPLAVPVEFVADIRLDTGDVQIQNL